MLSYQSLAHQEFPTKSILPRWSECHTKSVLQEFSHNSDCLETVSHCKSVTLRASQACFATVSHKSVQKSFLPKYSTKSVPQRYRSKCVKCALLCLASVSYESKRVEIRARVLHLVSVPTWHCLFCDLDWLYFGECICVVWNNGVSFLLIFLCPPFDKWSNTTARTWFSPWSVSSLILFLILCVLSITDHHYIPNVVDPHMGTPLHHVHYHVHNFPFYCNFWALEPRNLIPAT